jgi:hypothetical protein
MRCFVPAIAVVLFVSGCAHQSGPPSTAAHIPADASAPDCPLRVTDEPNSALTKQDRLQLEQCKLSAAALSPPPKDPTFDPPATSTPPRKLGIIANDQSPLPASGFSSTDEWSGPSISPSRWLYVYAGRAGEQPGGTPAVLVWSVTADQNVYPRISRVRIYDAPPTLSGYLQIVAWHGHQLSLTSTTTDAPAVPKGNAPIIATFDVASDTFSA